MTFPWLTIGAAVLLALGLLYLLRAVTEQVSPLGHLALLDRYAAGDSLLHRRDPRAKCVGLLAFVASVVLVPTEPLLRPALYTGLLLSLLFLSRVPLRFVLRQFLLLVPFLAIVAVGVWAGGRSEQLLEVSLRGGLSLAAVVLLTVTTPFPDLLYALRSLGLPKLLVNVLAFMARYLRVLLTEGERLAQAYQARAVGPRRLAQAATLGRVVGVFFLRTYERAERIYLAMLARGFEGEFRTLSPPRWTAREVAYLLAFLAVLAGIAVLPNLGLCLMQLSSPT